MVNITPYELYILIEETIEKLNNLKYNKPTELFKVMLAFYLSPKELLMVRRFNKKAVNILLELIITNYKKALVNPGEMVGIIAAPKYWRTHYTVDFKYFSFCWRRLQIKCNKGCSKN